MHASMIGCTVTVKQGMQHHALSHITPTLITTCSRYLCMLGLQLGMHDMVMWDSAWCCISCLCTLLATAVIVVTLMIVLKQMFCYTNTIKKFAKIVFFSCMCMCVCVYHIIIMCVCAYYIVLLTVCLLFCTLCVSYLRSTEV